MNELITDRCRVILKILLTNNGITTELLANLVGVSKRTILKDLEIIKDVVESNGAKLIKKPGVGIRIESDECSKDKLDKISFINNYKVPNSPVQRRNYIIMNLLENLEYITIQEIADKMYVSRGTAEADLEFAESWLEKNNIKLDRRPNKGIKILGNEVDKRAAISELLSEFIKAENLINVEESTSTTRIEDLSNYLDGDLLSLFSDIDIIKIEDHIIKLERRLGYRFSDTAFVTLIIHIAIAIKRVLTGREVELSNDFLENIEKQKEYKNAKFIIKNLEKSFNLILPRDEYAYITMHILGSKIQQNIIESNEMSLSNDLFDRNILDLCSEMIYRVDSGLHVNLIKDSELLKSLALHVRTAINRILNGMSIKNPYLNEIQKFYPTAFEMAVVACKVIHEKYNVEVNEDEIAYMAMHFGAAMERCHCEKKEKLDVIIICSSGMGTAQLVASKIRRIFDEIKIVKVMSATELGSKYVLDDIDFVISTIPVKLCKIPVIVVNPFLPTDDVDKITKLIGKYKTPFYKSSINKSNMLKKLFKKDLILIEEDEVSKEDVLRTMADLLRKRNYVKEGFYNSILEREKIASTANENVAIPHALPGYVIKSAIGVCVLKRSIIWGGNSVYVVFMLALGEDIKEELQELFDNLYEIINDKSKIQKINSENITEEDIYKLVIGSDK